MLNVKRLVYSFKNAIVGVGHAWHTQQSFRIQVVIATLVIIMGIVFKIDNTEWLFVLTSIVGVIVAELINTAIELVVDLVTTKKSKRAQLSKDVSAAAVLIIAIFAVTIGIGIFMPKIIGVFI